MKEFFTAEEIAPPFGVKPQWLLRHTRAAVAGTDVVPHVRVGKMIRFRTNELRDYFGRHAVGK